MKSTITKIDEERKRSLFAAETQQENLGHFLISKAYDTFFENIPLEYIRTLPVIYAMWFGLFAYCITLAGFVAFTNITYKQSMKEQFISLDRAAGLCSDVTRPLTGTYLATNDGYWEGSQNFNYSNAIFEFHFSNFKANDKTYEEQFNEIRNNILEEIGNKGKKQGIVYNLLYWMHYVSSFSMDDDSSEQSFGFVGEPGDIFNRQYMKGNIANASTDCWLKTYIAYNQDLARIKMTWDASNYEDVCSGIMNSFDLGYRVQYDLDSFTVTLDLVTLNSALAVNLGILPFEFLEDVGSGHQHYSVNDKSVLLQRKYDPRYPRMTPMVCATWDTTDTTSDDGQYDDDYYYDDQYDDDYYYDYDDGFPFASHLANVTKHFCFVRIGKILTIPTLNHFHDSCINCEVNISRCNVFDFVSGLIMFDDEVDPDDSTMTLEFAMNNSARELNDKAQLAAKSSAWGSVSSEPEAFAFCDNKCSMISVSIYDSRYTVSPYFYDLPEAHCTDTFNVEGWKNIAKVPPSELTEPYYKCYSYRSNALINAMGIAAGNVGFWAPIVLSCGLLPLIYLFFMATGVVVEKEAFSDAEKQSASKELAVHLLSIASNKNIAAFKPNGILVQLAQELRELSEVDNNITDNGDNDNGDIENGYTKPHQVSVKTPPLKKAQKSVFFNSAVKEFKMVNTDLDDDSDEEKSESCKNSKMQQPQYVDSNTGQAYDTSQPSFKGWLTKQSVWLKDWRRRYFILKGSKLFFAKSEHGAPHGMIDLSACMTVKSAELKDGRPNAIEVSTANTTFYMFADTEKEKYEWIGAIERAIVQASSTFTTEDNVAVEDSDF